MSPDCLPSGTVRILLAGTSVVSVRYLEILVGANFNVVGILTRCPKRKGRGLKLLDPPIKDVGIKKGIPIFQSETLAAYDFTEMIRNLKVDLGILIDYGIFIPPVLMAIPKLGWWNIHYSCLPLWRGAAPVHRAILNRDVMTGVTIIQMDKGMDSGPILISEKCAVSVNDNFSVLKAKLSVIGERLLLDLLTQLCSVQPMTLLPSVPQVGPVSIARKVSKNDALIHWHKSAADLRALVAAFVEGPVAHFFHPAIVPDAAIEIKVFQAEVIDADYIPPPDECGMVRDRLNGAVTVQTGRGCLRILVAQLPCRRILPIAEIMTSRPQLFKLGIVLNHSRRNDETILS